MALPSCPLVTSYNRLVPGMCDPAVTRRQPPRMLATHIHKDEASFVREIDDRKRASMDDLAARQRRGLMPTLSVG
jgi:hypothetical protein